MKDGEYATDEKTIANDLYVALSTILFKLYPSFGKNPFYIFGESYAGTNTPFISVFVSCSSISPTPRHQTLPLK